MSTNLLQFFPPGTRRVLELGCADGALGALVLQKRLALEYVGVEVREKEAEVARGRLTQVFCGDGEKLELPFAEGYFDIVLYGDSLEHLRDPALVLAAHRRLLRPGGLVLASIPNARNLFVVDQLLHGNWTYTDWGLLDRTHLRFFTLREVRKLFDSVGLTIEHVEFSTRPGSWFTKMHPPGLVHPDWIRLYDLLQERLAKGDDITENLRKLYFFDHLGREEAAEFFAVQFHVKARKPTSDQ